MRNNSPEEMIRQDVSRSLVEEYGYDKTDIEMGFLIKTERTRNRIDICIFHEYTSHTQENVYLIAEITREDVNPSDKKEGLTQLESYIVACQNCSFALWVGKERLAFRILDENGKKTLNIIPDVPKRGEKTIPKPTRGSLVPAVSLKQVFQRIHNYIYANQGFQKDKAFEELLKLIFIKVYDEQYSPTLQFYILPGEDIFKARDRLMALFLKVQQRYLYIFKGSERIELNDRVLEYVISELQRFSLVDTKTDVKGAAYEELVGPNLRGDRGEFFTPRNVCTMTIEMLFSLIPKEKLMMPGGIKLLDPAAGTGGFLLAGIQKIKQLLSQRGFKHDQLRNLVRDIAETNFFGIDFNPFLVKVAQMNLVMHGNGSSNMVHANSLKAPSNWNTEARNKIELGDFDLVVTNPPFGTKAVIDNPDILSQFELATFQASSQRTALPPEQLFIERCLHFLKPNGILAIVLPDGILGNPGLNWIREWILKKTYLIASIDQPIETFQPYTGTQTSILILKKKKPEQEAHSEDYPIFMAIPEKVGHDRRGKPIFKTTPEGEHVVDEKGQPIIDDHLPIVAELFKEWLKRKGMV